MTAFISKATSGDGVLAYQDHADHTQFWYVPLRVSVSFDLTNTDGTPTTDGEIMPNRINTGVNGDSIEPIAIKIQKPGVYLVRAQFNDRASRAVGYSAPLIVQSQ